jgi:antitoxin component of MazEF toxin-antitoxin module
MDRKRDNWIDRLDIGGLFVRQSILQGGIPVRKVQKWGNSLAVRLPIKLARRLMFDEGDIVEVTLEDDAIVIRKSAKPSPKQVDLAQLTSDAAFVTVIQK